MALNLERDPFFLTRKALSLTHPPFVHFLDRLGFAMPAKLSTRRDLVVSSQIQQLPKLPIFNTKKETTTKSLSQVPTSL
jgi:hypothetical protein